jgi:hypothetical protein
MSNYRTNYKTNITHSRTTSVFLEARICYSFTSRGVVLASRRLAAEERQRVRPGEPRGAQESPEKPKSAQESPGGPGRARESPGEPRRAQESTREPKRTQVSPGEPRKVHESPGVPRRTQKGPRDHSRDQGREGGWGGRGGGWGLGSDFAAMACWMSLPCFCTMAILISLILHSI